MTRESIQQQGPFSGLLILQLVLTVIGTVVAAYTLFDTFSSGATITSGLFAILYVLAFLAMIAYACFAFKREGDGYFQTTTYAYAALLGVQILQNGQFMAGLGLSEVLTLFINAANLIAFACVVKFSDKLAKKTLAVGYISAAVLFKLVAELVLIVLFFEMVTPYQVLKALSVPILGVTLLVAYLSRRQRLQK